MQVDAIREMAKTKNIERITHGLVDYCATHSRVRRPALIPAGSSAGFILYDTASTRLYPAKKVAKSTGGFDLAQYMPASHAGNRKHN